MASHSTTRIRTARRAAWGRSVRVAVALSLGVVTLPFLSAAAQAVPGGIAIDGNQAGASDDWEGYHVGDAGFSLIADPIGSNDGSGITGQEDDNDGVGTTKLWTQTKSTASPKADIGNVLVSSFRSGGDDDLFAAIAFDRGGGGNGGTGTQRYYIELNQSSSQTINPDREKNDIRAILAINGSDIQACQGVQLWTGSQWGATKSCTGIVDFKPNTGSITDFFGSPWAVAGALPVNQFYEVSLNLTDLGATTCPVAGFNTFHMRSQEGNENGDQGQLKDWVRGPIDIPSDCGSLEIVKRDAETGEPVTVGGTVFEISPDPTAGSTGDGPVTVVDDNTAAADLTDADSRPGYVRIADVDPDLYTVRETAAPEGYLLPPPGCDDADDTDRCTTKRVTRGGTATFSFSDKRRYDAPTIQKVAAAAYDATYTWDLEKTVADDDEPAGPKATQNVPEGTDARFDYAVTVREVARKTSNYRVTGTVTLGNSNPVPMTVTLTDRLTDGTVCTFPGSGDASDAAGLQVVLPAGDPEIVLGYTCAPGKDARDGTNVATVSWDRSVYPQNQAQVDDPPTEPGSDTARADYVFKVDKETNKTVHVVDDKHEFDPEWVNTWGEGDNPETRSYSKTYSGTPGTCTTYDNTATITETGLQKSARAEVCVGRDLKVTKNRIASLVRTYAFGLDKSAADTTLDVDPATGKATADYTVTVTDGPATDSKWVMKGDIVVSNPNDWQDITLTGIVDAYNGDSESCAIDTAAGLTVPASTTRTFPYTCTFEEQPAYDGFNRATVTWDAAAAATPSGTATGTAKVEALDWAVSEVGRTVNVVDDKTVAGASHALGPVTWAKKGTVHEFTYSLDLQGVPGRCVDYTNTATITETGQKASETVTVCAPQDVRVTKDGAGTYDRTYLWTIGKSARDTTVTTADGSATFHYAVTVAPNGFTDGGWEMTGDITVENPNDYKTMTVDLTDVPSVGGGAQCLVEDGTGVVVPKATLVDGEIVPGRATRTYSCTFDSQPTYDGGTNRAVATWDGGSASSPEVSIPWTLDDTTDAEITVTDDKVDLATPEVLGTWKWADGKKTFTYDLTLEGVDGTCTDFTNTAMIEETGQDADETVTLCAQSPLSVRNEPAATYDRTYLWQIDKVADKQSVEIAEGGIATVHYKVGVGPRTGENEPGYRDGGWTMTGTITVTNPNDAAVGELVADVTDVTDVGGGAKCTVVGGEGLTVGPGEEVLLGYECTFTSKPSYEGTNTATVAWTGAGGADSRSDEADVAFTLDDEIDRYVDVTDDKVTLTEPETIGEGLDWFDGRQVLDYDLDLGGEAGSCVDHTNVAQIVQTGQSAEETVTVCSEAALQLEKSVEASFDRTYHWRLDKVAGQLERREVTDGDTAVFGYTVTATPVVPEDGVYDDHGFEMGGTITVTNPNTYEGGSITADVVDVPNVGAGVTCDVVDGDGVEIAPEQTVVLDYECTVTSRPDYTGTNVAIATWEGPDGERSAPSEPTAVRFRLDDEIDKTVSVVDDKTVPGQAVELGEATWNAQGTPTVFDYELPLTGTLGDCEDFTNTATIELDGSPDLTADATVTLCVQADAVLANVVDASYDRSYAWSIDKVASGTRFSVGDDGTATVDYTVAATPGAATDSGWEMAGSLTVSNPNAYKELDLDVSTVTDLGDGVACVLDEGQDLTVPALGQRVLTYTCTFDGQPAYDGTDTTTVGWGSGSVAIETPVAFDLDQETDRVVDVVDDQTVPGTEVALGQAEWNAEGTPVTFGYSLDLAADVNECRTYTNTAAIVQTGQVDDATVEVCGPEILPEEEFSPRPRPPVVAGVETVTPGLPSTGGPAGLLAWGGAAMLLTGGALLLGHRRGRSQS